MILGQEIPNFSAETSHGKIDSFHEWIGEGNWAILFSHPADFTPVCTTELSRAAQLAPEFEMRNVKMIALSCDSVASHTAWIKDIADFGRVPANPFPFPIIADEGLKLATELGMIDPDEKDPKGMPLSARALLIIGPDRRLKLQILYPATTGRSFEEVLRVVDSLQLTAQHKVATPADWIPGSVCMVLPTLSDEQATSLFGDSVKKTAVPSGKNYLRHTPMPTSSEGGDH